VADIVFARVKRKEITTCAISRAYAGIGLMAGRIGNVINGELWG